MGKSNIEKNDTEKIKIKLWKKILILIGMLLIVFITVTIIKLLIIENLNNNWKKEVADENVYVKTIMDDRYVEAYRKEDTVKLVINDNVKNEKNYSNNIS